MKSGIGLLCAAMLCLCAINPCAAERRALLMQVGHYQDKLVPRIMSPNGKQGDVLLMRKVLELPKYDFKVTPLEDADASKAGILTALDKLGKEAGPDDAVLVYFSGHGARSNNKFSICPWDAHAIDPANDITEDVLARWVKGLKTKNVTIILDCCFSEAPVHKGIRSIPKQAKFMGRDPAGKMLSDIQVNLPEDRSVLLTAASQNEIGQQFANPPYGADQKWYGVFTYYLYSNMLNAQPEMTYEQLIEAVRKDVSLWSQNEKVQYAQTPEVYASPALKSRALFTPVAKDPDPVPDPKPYKPYVLVKKVDGDHVVLDAGKDKDVIEKAEYAVFPEGETKFSDPPIANIRVDSVSDKEATASRIDGDLSKIGPKSRATLTLYPQKLPTSDALLARVSGPKEVATPFQAALKSVEGFKLESDPKKDVQVVLRVAKDGDAYKCTMLAAEGDPNAARPELRTDVLLDDVRPTRTAATPEELAGKVTHALNLYAALHGLANMRNPNPAFQVSLTPAKKINLIGDTAEFTIKADQDCYIFMIDVDGLGVPTLISPTLKLQDNHIQANQEIKKRFPASPPAGKETIILLATQNEALAKKLKAALFADMAPEPPPNQPKSRRIGEEVQADLGDLQKLPLAEWTTTIMDVQTLQKDGASTITRRILPAAGSRGVDRTGRAARTRNRPA